MMPPHFTAPVKRVPVRREPNNTRYSLPFYAEENTAPVPHQTLEQTASLWAKSPTDLQEVPLVGHILVFISISFIHVQVHKLNLW